VIPTKSHPQTSRAVFSASRTRKRRLNLGVQINAAAGLARREGGDVDKIARLTSGLFNVASEVVQLDKVRMPICLSHLPSSALTEEEVLARHGRNEATDAASPRRGSWGVGDGFSSGLGCRPNRDSRSVLHTPGMASRWARPSEPEGSPNRIRSGADRWCGCIGAGRRPGGSGRGRSSR
jgi:hypothetical protein